jgi:hypothetical protein
MFFEGWVCNQVTAEEAADGDAVLGGARDRVRWLKSCA